MHAGAYELPRDACYLLFIRDYTAVFLFSPCVEGHGKREVRKAPPSGGVEDTARRHIASELLQTERNFVNILNIIVKVCRVNCKYSVY